MHKKNLYLPDVCGFLDEIFSVCYRDVLETVTTWGKKE